MRGCLEDMGLSRQLIDDEMVSMLVAIAGGEAQGDDARRLYAFAEDIPDWESDEPVWLLLTTDERAQLIQDGIVRPSVGLERGYDPGV